MSSEQMPTPQVERDRRKAVLLHTSSQDPEKKGQTAELVVANRHSGRAGPCQPARRLLWKVACYLKDIHVSVPEREGSHPPIRPELRPSRRNSHIALDLKSEAFHCHCAPLLACHLLSPPLRLILM